MTALRAFLHAHRTFAVLLLACALAMKVLVPAGYMIGSQTRTISIQICDGVDHGAVRQILVGQTGSDAVGKADHGQADHGKSDGVCPYGALGHASLAGTDPVLLATALAFILALAFAPLIPACLSHIPHIRPPLRGPPGKTRLT